MTAARLGRLVAMGLVAAALGGCAASGRSHAVPAPAPPPAPAATPAEPAPQGAPPGALPGDVPQHAGPIASPWDTAGTASGKAARRVHVYPSGLSPLGQKLVDSLPDPAGASAPTAAPTPARPAPAKAAPASIGESGCWEVQLLVTADKGRAEEVVKRIERELDLAAWVRTTGALYRVRAGGCLSPDGAEQLARELKQQGWPEAFRVMRDAP